MYSKNYECVIMPVTKGTPEIHKKRLDPLGSLQHSPDPKLDLKGRDRDKGKGGNKTVGDREGREERRGRDKKGVKRGGETARGRKWREGRQRKKGGMEEKEGESRPTVICKSRRYGSAENYRESTLPVMRTRNPTARHTRTNKAR